MSTIVNATSFRQSGSSPITITIPSTTAGNCLTAVIYNDSGYSTTCSASGASFVQKADLFSSQVSVNFAYNIPASITSVNINFSTYQEIWGYIIETSGQGTSSDPWDTLSSYENAYETTPLGCGSITTGVTGAGLCIAVFLDQYSGSTVSDLTQGSGWTDGAFSNHSYYEYQTSAASTGYGGTTNQASVPSGAGYRFRAVIFNLFDAQDTPNAVYLDCAFNNNQASEIKGTSATFQNSYGALTRVSTSARSYMVFMQETSTICRLYKVVAGAATQLGSDIAHNYVQNDVLRLRSVNNVHTPLINGVAQGNYSDSALTSGRVGWVVYGTSQTVDDWQGGNFSALAMIISEAVQLTEKLLTKITTAAAALVKFALEVLQISDVVSKVSTLRKIISEAIQLSEKILTKLTTPAVLLIKFILETLQISESTRRVRALGRIVKETIQITEKALSPRTIRRILIEAIQLSEKTLRALMRRRSITENIQIVDSNNKVRTIRKLFVETVQLIDGNKGVRVLRRLISEAVQISEKILNKTMRQISKIVAESIQIAEGVKRILTFRRIQSETIQISEKLARVRAIRKLLTEVVQLIEGNRAYRTLRRVVVEAIQISEKILPKTLRQLVKSITDALQLSEKISRGAVWRRTISETLAINESTLRSRTIRKILAETVWIAESLIKKAATTRLAKVVVEVIQIADANFYVRILRRIQKEVVQIVDVVQYNKMRWVIKIVSESISIAESVWTRLFQIIFPWLRKSRRVELFIDNRARALMYSEFEAVDLMMNNSKRELTMDGSRVDLYKNDEEERGVVLW